MSIITGVVVFYTGIEKNPMDGLACYSAFIACFYQALEDN